MVSGRSLEDIRKAKAEVTAAVTALTGKDWRAVRDKYVQLELQRIPHQYIAAVEALVAPHCPPKSSSGLIVPLDGRFDKVLSAARNAPRHAGGLPQHVSDGDVKVAVRRLKDLCGAPSVAQSSAGPSTSSSATATPQPTATSVAFQEFLCWYVSDPRLGIAHQVAGEPDTFADEEEESKFEAAGSRLHQRMVVERMKSRMRTLRSRGAQEERVSVDLCFENFRSAVSGMPEKKDVELNTTVTTLCPKRIKALLIKKCLSQGVPPAKLNGSRRPDALVTLRFGVVKDLTEEDRKRLEQAFTLLFKETKEHHKGPVVRCSLVHTVEKHPAGHSRPTSPAAAGTAGRSPGKTASANVTSPGTGGNKSNVGAAAATNAKKKDGSSHPDYEIVMEVFHYSRRDPEVIASLVVGEFFRTPLYKKENKNHVVSFANLFNSIGVKLEAAGGRLSDFMVDKTSVHDVLKYWRMGVAGSVPPDVVEIFTEVLRGKDYVEILLLCLGFSLPASIRSHTVVRNMGEGMGEYAATLGRRARIELARQARCDDSTLQMTPELKTALDSNGPEEWFRRVLFEAGTPSGAYLKFLLLKAVVTALEESRVDKRLVGKIYTVNRKYVHDLRSVNILWAAGIQLDATVAGLDIANVLPSGFRSLLREHDRVENSLGRPLRSDEASDARADAEAVFWAPVIPKNLANCRMDVHVRGHENPMGLHPNTLRVVVMGHRRCGKSFFISQLRQSTRHWNNSHCRGFYHHVVDREKEVVTSNDRYNMLAKAKKEGKQLPPTVNNRVELWDVSIEQADLSAYFTNVDAVVCLFMTDATRNALAKVHRRDTGPSPTQPDTTDEAALSANRALFPGSLAMTEEEVGLRVSESLQGLPAFVPVALVEAGYDGGKPATGHKGLPAILAAATKCKTTLVPPVRLKPGAASSVWYANLKTPNDVGCIAEDLFVAADNGVKQRQAAAEKRSQTKANKEEKKR